MEPMIMATFGLVCTIMYLPIFSAGHRRLSLDYFRPAIRLVLPVHHPPRLKVGISMSSQYRSAKMMEATEGWSAREVLGWSWNR